MSMNRCPRCEAELTADAPQGLCPACLLERAVFPFESTPEPAETAAHERRFVPPTIAELDARFPQLEIQALLGQGGMGAVYKARQRMLDRVVALKILPPEIKSDPAFAERFTREARALARLTHPNIVTVFEFGESDGLYYLMMEFVDGVNLRQSIQSESLTPSSALAVVSQICDALQYAHDEGVVHRDIKPENVLLDKRGRVKIADFGLAKLLGLSPIEVTLTATHQVMGTLHYMAPEQLERPLEVDHRADIYSLGVVFYELLTGELPLGRFKLPSERRQLDIRLDDVVLKTLEREPKRRYQHVSEVKTDIDHISSSDVLSASNDPFARPGTARRLPTVPFALLKNGLALAHGVLRAEGDRITLDFEVTERASMYPFYSNFKAGLHEISIGLDDVSAIRLEKGWFSGMLQIQTDSVRAVSGIPGADRGRASLAIASQDIETAEQFVRGIGSRITGDTSVYGSQSRSAHGASFHPGRLGLGFVMLGLGVGMLVLGAKLKDQGYLWTGIGVAIGGGCVGASAFFRDNTKSEQPRLVGPRTNLIVMAFVFAVMGAAMLIAGVMSTDHELVWIGFGLVMAGGGCWCGAWQEEQEKTAAEPEPAPPSPPVKPSKPELAAFDDLRWENSRLKIPAIGLCVAGAIDCLSLLALAGLGVYVATQPANGFGIPGILELMLIGSGTIFGIGRLLGGINMIIRRSYTLSIVGAMSALLPCGVAGMIGLPFGIWSLIVLNTPEARREFELAAELRERRAYDRQDYS